MLALNESQQRLVISETKKQIQKASVILDKPFKMIPVEFDLRGHTIGMYKVSKNKRVIRYNAQIFAKYFEQNLRDTVPHEVAHYIVDMQYGRKNIRPHGTQWRQLMEQLGAKPERTANYDLTGVPKRRYTTVAYQCGCQQHQLGIRRHNKLAKQQVRYFCRRCGDSLSAL
tara:strand:- start:28 stop:537 length:510 start_codon:yes stop_codon:yes gene_type:complete